MSLARARALLAHHFGYPDFRPAQRRVIHSVLQGRDTLAILPTGGGKSICFQIPALVLGGLTIVISPLVALMQDQVDAAVARGLPAAAMTGGITPERRAEILQAAAQGNLRLLYVSPERLPTLVEELARAAIKPALFAIDEAHCIAEWGHDFRPSYRQLKQARRALDDPPTIALTGSATPAVRDDIVKSLGLGHRHGRSTPFDLHLGSFDRRNLWFGAMRVKDRDHRLRTLLNLLRGEDRVAIVYAPTRGVTEALTLRIQEAGFRAAPYHAGLGKPVRRETLERFLATDVEVIVATCAFGMGIDKPDVRLVIHWTMPPTPESYYQEAGRAGRDGRFARCIGLTAPEDADLHRRQLDVTFPPERLLEDLWSGKTDPARLPAATRESADRLRRELQPERGRVDWTPIRLRRRHALGRIEAMTRYAEGKGCRRRALLSYFGEKIETCAGCDRCASKVGPPARPPRPARHPDPEDPLLDALRRWRIDAARSIGAPPSSIVDDSVLRAIAAARPKTRAALARIPGVGPRLLAKFKDEILYVCAQASPNAD